MIRVKEIKSSKDLLRFIKFPFELYKNSKYWVPPIISEELEVLNKYKNPVFKNAFSKYFIAEINNKIVGRVAAIINWVEVKELKKPKIRFGWFDVIDDINVTRALMDKVIQIGQKNKLSIIEGPVGFSNMDKAGMLTFGFDEPNTMITNYNYEYYPIHFNQLKYDKLAQWVEYEIKIFSSEDSPEKVKKFSKLILERYSLKILDFRSTKEIIPYVDQMFDLLGKTYNNLQTFVPIQEYQIDYYKKKYFKYIHPEFIKCVIDQDKALVGFLISMPSFSKALKKSNGKLFPFGFIRILLSQWFIKKVSLYLIGIRPDYQNKGVVAILMNELQKTFNKFNVPIIETNPELEENKAIQALWKNYNNRLHKKRVTFTKKI